MNKETISIRQGISVIILFLTGTSSIMTVGIAADQNMWMAIIIAILFSLPMALIYARIHYVFPNKNLFDIVEICFGKFIGKGLSVLYVWFWVDIGAIIVRNVSQFLRVNAVPNTPIVITMICMSILCGWAIKEGIEVLGRIGELFIIVFVIAIFITILLLIPQMDINYLRPIISNGIGTVMKGAFFTFSYPFGEIIAFTMAFSSFKYKKSSYKIYLLGVFIGGIIVLAVSLTTVLVIGINNAKAFYYPTYSAVSHIDIGNVLQRLEVIIGIVFVLGGFIKISIYLLAICKGIGKIFGCTDYRFIVIPITLLIINLSYLEFDSIMDYYEWNLTVYPYYSFPFLVIMPIVIGIVAKIRSKQVKK